MAGSILNKVDNFLVPFCLMIGYLIAFLILKRNFSKWSTINRLLISLPLGLIITLPISFLMGYGRIYLRNVLQEEFPSCSNEICIKSVHSHIFEKDEMLAIDFEVTKPLNSIEDPFSPEFKGETILGIIASDDEYLFGAVFPEGSFRCFSSSDIPWANGFYTHSCGIALPFEWLKREPKIGELINVELKTYNFSDKTIILLMEGQIPLFEK